MNDKAERQEPYPGLVLGKTTVIRFVIRGRLVSALAQQAFNSKPTSQFAATQAVRIDGVSRITGSHESPRSRLT
jgi:hypothetical protein